MNRAKSILWLAVVVCGTAACSKSNVDKEATDTEAALARTTAEVSDSAEPGYDSTVVESGAPFSVSYDVIGTPIVGSPVTVDLRIASTLGSRPVRVSYRINDASAMKFHEAQPLEVEMAPAADEDFIVQQVTVVPQREGRLYLNVGASVETGNGSKSSLMAIPIQVGSGGRILEDVGEVQLDENGEQNGF